MAQKNLKKGIFITFEGCEGSGKSTQSGRLVEDLRLDGYDVEYTQEPGGSRLGTRIKQMLLGKHAYLVNDKAELLLFEADRAQHVEEFIRPKLKQGKIVICDRFNTATFAYQGYGLGMDLGFIKKIDDMVTGGLLPDLTILLDVDAKIGLERARKTRLADRIEERASAFHNKVRKGYLILAKRSGGRIKVLKSANGAGETYKNVKKEVYGFIARYKRAR